MRRWFVYIEKSYDPDYPEGNVIVYPFQTTYAFKGERKDMLVVDIDTQEKKVVARVVGLGHYDFKDEEDYKNRVWDVLRKKMKDVGIDVKEGGE